MLYSKVDTALKLAKMMQDWQSAHVLQVFFLSSKLGKCFLEVGKISEIESEVLSVASILHDIGYLELESGYNHHIHSEKFILRQNWPGWDPPTVRLCARVARLHRKKVIPEELSQDGFTRDEQKKILRLAAILRVADALDRSHTQSIKSLVLLHEKNWGWKIVITKGKAHAEDLYGFCKKRDLWNEIYGPVELVGSDGSVLSV